MRAGNRSGRPRPFLTYPAGASRAECQRLRGGISQQQPQRVVRPGPPEPNPRRYPTRHGLPSPLLFQGGTCFEYDRASALPGVCANHTSCSKSRDSDFHSTCEMAESMFLRRACTMGNAFFCSVFRTSFKSYHTFRQRETRAFAGVPFLVAAFGASHSLAEVDDSVLRVQWVRSSFCQSSALQSIHTIRSYTERREHLQVCQFS